MNDDSKFSSQNIFFLASLLDALTTSTNKNFSRSLAIVSSSAIIKNEFVLKTALDLYFSYNLNYDKSIEHEIFNLINEEYFKNTLKQLN